MRSSKTYTDDNWHYRFNKVWWWKVTSTYESERPRDFCTYWRHVTLSIIAFMLYYTLIAAGGILMLILAVTMAMGIWQIITSAAALAQVGKLMLVVLAIAGAVGLLYYANKFIPQGFWKSIGNSLKYVGSKIVLGVYYVFGVPLYYITVVPMMWLTKGVVYLWEMIPSPQIKSNTGKAAATNAEKEPSDLTLKYRSWKDRYCPLIEYETT
jgi:hypothetical protein